MNNEHTGGVKGVALFDNKSIFEIINTGFREGAPIEKGTYNIQDLDRLELNTVLLINLKNTEVDVLTDVLNGIRKERKIHEDLRRSINE